MKSRRLRSAASPSPLVVLAVLLAALAAYSYLRGAYGPATALGIGAILTSLFVLLTDG